jgi:hypothetical protein
LSRNIIGDITGSVFGDDSTILVDAVSNYIYGNVSASTLRTSETKIALGNGAGATNQTTGAIAIGAQAGETNQSLAISIGFGAGQGSQGFMATAVGHGAGQVSQGTYAVAIGTNTGQVSQGAYAVAIGSNAGTTNQPANSIIINAGSSALQGSAAGFFVDPVRNINGGTFLTYDTTTKEIGYSTGIRSENDINIDINLTDSTLRRWTFGEDGNLTLPNDSIVSAGGSGGLTLGGNFDVKIVADYTDNNLTWTFNGNDGSVTFPDGTVQETAWTGRNDLIGSVFADDSTLLVDAVNGAIPGYVKISDLKTALQDGAGDYAAFKAWVLANL